MDDFTMMYVFFAVTTAAVILITALSCALIVALIRLSVTLNRFAREVKEEAEELRGDLDHLREDLRKGFRLVPFVKFFGKAAGRIAASKKKPRARARKTTGE